MSCFCLTFAYSNTENVNRRVRGRIKRSGVPCRGSADMQQTLLVLRFYFFLLSFPTSLMSDEVYREVLY